MGEPMTFLGMPIVEGEPLTDSTWICTTCRQVYFEDELHFCTPGQSSVTLKIRDAQLALSGDG
jgi:hypothetical protein